MRSADVVYDVVPRDFKVVKQSAIQGNIGVWQSNFSRSSNDAPMVVLMASRQLMPIAKNARKQSMVAFIPE
jgi:hypothetical protein